MLCIFGKICSKPKIVLAYPSKSLCFRIMSDLYSLLPLKLCLAAEKEYKPSLELKSWTQSASFIFSLAYHLKSLYFRLI